MEVRKKKYNINEPMGEPITDFFEGYLEKNMINPTDPDTSTSWVNKSVDDKKLHELYINNDLKATVEVETTKEDIEFTFTLLDN